MEELPLDFPVEVSAKHVHLTTEAVEQLFGKGATLTPKRPLSQPGQFLSEERVTLVTPKGQIENVAVLGPVRPAIQTELSVTDCRTLGINAPLRLSGDLSGAADVYIVGPKGMIHAKGSAIVAQAHIHITPAEAEPIGIKDGQLVSVTIGENRKLTLENVICRVSSSAALAMHIDFDEANACMLPKNATARMKVAKAACGKAAGSGNCGSGNAGMAASGAGCSSGSQAEAKTCSQQKLTFEGKLMTERDAANLVASGSKSGCKKVVLAKGTLVTPSAKDTLFHAGFETVVGEECA